MAQRQTNEERLRIIRQAMNEIANRRELSPQAKERGLRALRIAYEQAQGGRG